MNSRGATVAKNTGERALLRPSFIQPRSFSLRTAPLIIVPSEDPARRSSRHDRRFTSWLSSEARDRDRLDDRRSVPPPRVSDIPSIHPPTPRLLASPCCTLMYICTTVPLCRRPKMRSSSTSGRQHGRYREQRSEGFGTKKKR